MQDVATFHTYATGEDSILVRYDWSALDSEYLLPRLARGATRPVERAPGARARV